MSKRSLSYVAVLLFGIALGGVWQPFSGAGVSAQPGCQTFKETGFTVCGRFLEYWQKNGGLPQQGFPISSEFVEKSDLDGKTYTVQYFERAVFEMHPENKPPYDVLLSQLGTFWARQKYGNPPKWPNAPAPTQPPAPPQATGIEVKGSGQRVSDPITLKQGLAVFHSVHTGGTSNFIAELVDLTGKTLGLLANEIGPADEWRAERIPADGQYMLKVRADGAWTITITQPRGAYSAPQAQQQWSGKGSFVTELFSLKAGAVRIRAAHTNGSSNFIVTLKDGDGRSVELIANEIGPASVETIENIPANGVFLLEVMADGNWEVVLQQ